MTIVLSGHYFEILASLCGLLNIYFAVRASIWNWFFGILTVSIYLFIFFQTKLYADMALQLIYFILQIYGLYQWRYVNATDNALIIYKTPILSYINLLIAFLSLFGGIIYILKYHTDSQMVFLDAFTTALSLVAQWMMIKKWLENWLVWIVVNFISVGMYFSKNLYFTSGLYTILIILSVIGYFQWRTRLITTTRRHNGLHNN